MMLPRKIKPLFVLGVVCIIGSAWLTFAIETRRQPVRSETEADATASKAAVDPGARRLSSKVDLENDARKSVTNAGPELASPRGAARRRAADAMPEARRQERLAAARRELELLSVQKPESFLAIFDMMKQENRWDDKALDAARAASHGYILARTRILEGILRRYIDDPEADHALETEALARLDDEFKRKIDSLARDIPAMANVQEILTTTSLKAEAFAARDPESD